MEEQQIIMSKWRVMLQSSKKFIALGEYRAQEQDFIQAISVFNQTLIYLNPEIFKTSPSQILKEMWELNLKVYLELSELFIKIKRYDMASKYLEQVILNDENNERAKRLLQSVKKIQQKLEKKVNA